MVTKKQLAALAYGRAVRKANLKKAHSRCKTSKKKTKVSFDDILNELDDFNLDNTATVMIDGREVVIPFSKKKKRSSGWAKVGKFIVGTALATTLAALGYYGLKKGDLVDFTNLENKLKSWGATAKEWLAVKKAAFKDNPNKKEETESKTPKESSSPQEESKIPETPEGPKESTPPKEESTPPKEESKNDDKKPDEQDESKKILQKTLEKLTKEREEYERKLQEKKKKEEEQKQKEKQHKEELEEEKRKWEKRQEEKRNEEEKKKKEKEREEKRRIRKEMLDAQAEKITKKIENFKEAVENFNEKMTNDNEIQTVLDNSQPYRNDGWFKAEIKKYMNQNELTHYAKFIQNLRSALGFVKDYPYHPLSVDDFFSTDINFLFDKFDDLSYKNIMDGYGSVGAAQSSINDVLERFKQNNIYHSIARKEAESHRGILDYRKIQELIEDLHWNAINITAPVYRMLVQHKEV